jgi:hypothetical protein
MMVEAFAGITLRYALHHAHHLLASLGSETEFIWFSRLVEKIRGILGRSIPPGQPTSKLAEPSTIFLLAQLAAEIDCRGRGPASQPRKSSRQT